MQEKQLKKSTEYIKEAWRIYTKKENFIFFAKIMSVVAISSVVVGFVSGYFYPTELNNVDFTNIPKTIGFILISLVTIVLSLWSQSSVYFSILKMGSSEKEILKLGFTKILRFWVISLAYGIVVGFGAILLLIPAFIFGVWYSFSTLLVLDKDMGVVEAFKHSKEMAKGKFWKIFGRFVVFGLFTIVVSILLTIIPYIGPLTVSFIAPLFTLPFYLLYRDLSTDSGLN